MGQPTSTNRIPLLTKASQVPHFSLHEFQSREGWAKVHPAMLLALEYLRSFIWKYLRMEVEIIITGCIRTEAENEALAARYGWTHEGGTVSRTSKHLPKYGGIAVDFYARYKKDKSRVPQWFVGWAAAKFFDYVKYDYADGHTHADKRGVLDD